MTTAALNMVGRASPHIGRWFVSISPQIVESGVRRITRRIDSVTEPVDPFERIEKLGKLRKAGHLTEEEFSAQKAKILDRSLEPALFLARSRARYVTAALLEKWPISGDSTGTAPSALSGHPRRT